MKKSSRADIEFTVGSGNVFADLGLAAPEEELSKATLAFNICERVKALNLNGTQAAKRLGIPQPKVSRLLRGYADGMSVEKLLTCLNKLGQDVRIVVSDAPGGAAEGRLVLTRKSPAKGRIRPVRRRVAVAARRT